MNLVFVMFETDMASSHSIGDFTVGIRYIFSELRGEVLSWESQALEMLVKGMGLHEIP